MTNTTLFIKTLIFVVIFNGLMLYVYGVYAQGKSYAYEQSQETQYLDEIQTKSNDLAKMGDSRDLSNNNKLTDQTYGNAYTTTNSLWNIVMNMRISKLLNVMGETPLEIIISSTISAFVYLFDIIAVFVMIQAFKKS